MPAAEAPLGGRRLYFVGIGGSGMSAYANIARALGAEVRGWDVRDTIFMGSLEGIEVDIGGEPAPPAGWEVVVSTAHLHRIEGMPPGGLPRGARRGAAGDRGRRCPRQDDDRGDDRLRAPGDRPRPGVDHRRDRAAARRQRRRRRRLARRRGRRVRPLDRVAAPPDRGAHEHRARPSRRLRVRGRAARLLRRLARRGAARRPQLGAAARSSSSSRCPASTTARTQPRRSSRSSWPGVPRAEAEAALVALHGRRVAGSSSSASAAASPSTTTTATTRPSSR